MGFFKKAMASVGVGSAKVDAILDSSTVQAGKQVTGYIYIKGGSTEQKIDNIYLKVQTSYKKQVNDKIITSTATIQKVNIPVGQTINPKQEVNIPFNFVLTPETPVSIGKTKLWIETGLDIKMALDPTDRDYIKVLPHDYMQVVIGAFDRLGFRLRETENEYCPNKKGAPFLQEFEFVPTSTFKRELEELEVFFFILNGGIGLKMEIDRRARGVKGFFAEAFDMDETNTRLTISEDHLTQGPDYIAEQLHRYIKQYL